MAGCCYSSREFGLTVVMENDHIPSVRHTFARGLARLIDVTHRELPYDHRRGPAESKKNRYHAIGHCVHGHTAHR